MIGHRVLPDWPRVATGSRHGLKEYRPECAESRLSACTPLSSPELLRLQAGLNPAMPQGMVKDAVTDGSDGPRRRLCWFETVRLSDRVGPLSPLPLNLSNAERQSSVRSQTAILVRNERLQLDLHPAEG